MQNTLRTAVLLAAMTALFMGVGYLVGGQSGMMLAFGVAVATNLFAFWNSDKMVLRMQHAEPVDRTSAPDLYRMVEDLSARAGIPTPALYLIHTDQPNAFATGRNPQNAAVAVSTGLLQRLDTREVAGVVAHELAHIKNRDTLTMTITATFAGAISMLAQFGLFFGGGNNRDNPLGPIGTIAAVLIAPIAAAIVQMAVSRTREYQADRDGAEIAGDPMALASALAKISGYAERIMNNPAERNPAMAHMYIINPLNGRPGDNLFSTHPNVENRISALQQLAAEMSGGGYGLPADDGFVPRRETVRPGPVLGAAPRSSAWRTPASGNRSGGGTRPRGPWGS